MTTTAPAKFGLSRSPCTSEDLRGVILDDALRGTIDPTLVQHRCRYGIVFSQSPVSEGLVPFETVSLPRPPLRLSTKLSWLLTIERSTWRLSFQSLSSAC